MKNSDVADLLYGIADLLELQGADFKPQAYRKAARSIESMSDSVEALHQKGKLQDISGVGEGIARKIAAFLDEGTSSYYEELRKQAPKHIAELMDVPGLGPKKIMVLNEKLGIDSLKNLEAAVKKQKIRELAGFGEKSETEIAKGILLLKGGMERKLLGHALPVAAEIEARLQRLKEVEEVSIAGSLRRRKETIGDIDILAASSQPEKIMRFFTAMEDVSRVLAHGMTKSSIVLKSGMQVDLRVVERKSFGAALVYFTGSREHNVAIRGMAVKKGLKISEYGVFRRKDDALVAGRTEGEVYKTLGMTRIPPELRENRGEVEASVRGTLPVLIGYGDVRGDFHMHTRHTDGVNTVAEMVAAARKRKYEYIAITDHSPSMRIANGNTPEEMCAEIKEIRRMAEKIKGIAVFAGSEVDILQKGELDFPEEVLKKLDVVVASVHSGFKSPAEAMTKRIVTAMETGYVDIMGHPTGRRIYRREPYAADMKKIFRAAVDNNVLLEINGQPERMDLNDRLVRQAKDAGAKFVIDTDAHNTESLNDIQYGTAIARRGWLEKEDVINTYPLKKMKAFFRRMR